MKQPYSKPTIATEEIRLDQPVALDCIADFDDMRDLIDLGYFGDSSCGIRFIDGTLPGYDTICYHSNVQKAFTS